MGDLEEQGVVKPSQCAERPALHLSLCVSLPGPRNKAIAFGNPRDFEVGQRAA